MKVLVLDHEVLVLVLD